MFAKIRRRKILLSILLFIIIGLFQYYVLDEITASRLIQFAVLDCIMLIAVYSFRGFDLDTMKSLNASLISMSVGAIFGGLIATVFLLIFRSALPDYLNRWDIIFSVAVVSIIFPIVSKIFYHFIQGLVPPCKCYVLGSKKKFSGILKEIEKASHGKLTVAEWIEEPRKLELKLLEKNHCDIILIADWKLYQSMKEEVRNCLKLGYRKKFITTAVERWLKRIPMEVVDEFADYYETLFSDVNLSKRKRVLDIFIAVFIGIITLPFTIITGFLVLLFSGWPIIFKHKRIGLHGKEFMFYKFRSMKRISSKDLDALENPNGTIKQRVTLIGKLIRKIRFDELPQLWNIIKGDMSLIGPRPEMNQYHEKYKDVIPYYFYRSYLKPGITGWAQIHYNHTTNEEEYKKKTEYDLYYIKNRSIQLDVQITMMTVETMLGMRDSNNDL